MQNFFTLLKKISTHTHDRDERTGVLNVGLQPVYCCTTNTNKIFPDQKNDVAENAASFAFTPQLIYRSEKKSFMKTGLPIWKKMLLMVFFILAIAISATAQKFAVTSGNWSGSIWASTANGVAGSATTPTLTDAVTINSGVVVAVDVTANCASLSFLSTATTNSTVNINTGITLNITGALTIPRPTSTTNTVAIGAGILNAGSILYTNSGGGQRHVITIGTGGTLTVSGNIDCGGATGSATLTCTGTPTINAGGTFLGNGTGTFTAATSTVNFDGIVAQTIPNTTYSFSNIQVNNTSTGATLAGTETATNISGNLSVQSGIFNNGGFAMTLASTMAAVSGGGTKTFGATSTVNYGGTNQAVTADSYGNLSLSGSGNKTFAGSTTIANTLAISGTAIALLPNGSVSTSAFLTLAGTSELAGSWGGTASAATNKNTTFGTTTTGILNVTVGSCVAPTAFAVTGGGSYCSGGSGVAIGLSNSQTGINYQLFNGPTAVGSSVPGTGNPITFGNQTIATTYTVVATNSVGGCTKNMTGNAIVSINPNPSSSVNGSTNITCFGANDGTITIQASGGTGPYLYSVDNGATFQSSANNPFVYPGLKPNTPYQIRVKDSNGCLSQQVQ
ncbi:MAG TPA: hypothetical protein VK787_15595 [Puia sp.]|nr:hypothetical protein [Puia sp.]